MFQSLTPDLASPVAAVAAAGLFISACTIQTRTNTQDSLGQVNLSDWFNVSGLVAIACMLSVQSPYRPNQGAVARTPQQFEEINERHCLLNGWYPAILQQYTAVIDGTRYEIMGVEHDSQHTQTRLAVRLYNL